jgi:hypothetical protein
MRIFGLVRIFGLAFLAMTLLLTELPAQKGSNSIVLFDGKDLSAWRPATNWKVEEGTLTLKDRTDRQEHNDNYLWTKRQFSDFVLDLDFRIVPGVNSGIFLRTSDTNDPVQTGIEIQVSGSDPNRPLGRSSIGGIYDLVAPSKYAAKLNDWNHYTITCKGSKISVILNGQQTSEADLSRWVDAKKNPDGSGNKFTRAAKDFAREGYIGLQDHGTPAWYRNITLKELK